MYVGLGPLGFKYERSAVAGLAGEVSHVITLPSPPPPPRPHVISVTNHGHCWCHVSCCAQSIYIYYFYRAEYFRNNLRYSPLNIQLEHKKGTLEMTKTGKQYLDSSTI